MGSCTVNLTRTCACRVIISTKQASVCVCVCFEWLPYLLNTHTHTQTHSHQLMIVSESIILIFRVCVLFEGISGPNPTHHYPFCQLWMAFQASGVQLIGGRWSSSLLHRLSQFDEELFTLLDFGPEIWDLVMPISTISIYQNSSISIFPNFWDGGGEIINWLINYLLLFIPRWGAPITQRS